MPPPRCGPVTPSLQEKSEEEEGPGRDTEDDLKSGDPKRGRRGQGAGECARKGTRTERRPKTLPTTAASAGRWSLVAVCARR